MEEEALKKAEIPEGWRSEASLAGQWGLSRAELAEYRQSRLREGYHYGKVGGLVIYFTPDGIEQALRHFKPPSREAVIAAKMAARAQELAKWAHPPVPGTPLDANIARVLTALGNPRMIRAQTGEGRVFYVRVHSTKNFRKGMLLDLRSCRRVWNGNDGREEHGDGKQNGLPVYELMIPCPRFPGRWGWSALTNPHFGRARAYASRVRESPRTQ
jgi:hypothetical protein